ncbi:MAG: phosphatidylserine decarboxylase, partial [Gammaproteobacteria bacterium]|nr:phosphatidylserine decarboxylase [Gammaproteobacteria bacterium]
MSYFFIWFQHCLPHHALSSLVGFLANLRWPWWKNRFIRWFMHHYAVDMSLCEKKTPNEFTTFNDFFTRRLIPEALPKYTPRTLLSPISGRLISQGKISDLTLLQAKGHSFTLAALLGNYPPRAPLFREGHFLTFYLSPRDYHRVHMPLSGKLQEMFYIPGKLFSVNTLSTQKIPRLFARNERLVSMFETEMGPMAIIMVGALCVGSIETTWS